MRITFENGASVVDQQGFYVEASTIGLPPGEWPGVIDVVLAARGDEPEMPVSFVRESIDTDREGEVLSAFYATPLGSLGLIVVND